MNPDLRKGYFCSMSSSWSSKLTTSIVYTHCSSVKEPQSSNVKKTTLANPEITISSIQIKNHPKQVEFLANIAGKRLRRECQSQSVPSLRGHSSAERTALSSNPQP